MPSTSTRSISIAVYAALPLPEVEHEGIKVFARGRVAHVGTVRYSGYNHPVTLGGITVEPGSLLRGGDGAVIISEEAYPKIAQMCYFIRDFENERQFKYFNYRPENRYESEEAFYNEFGNDPQYDIK
jgi:hypothetical protein